MTVRSIGSLTAGKSADSSSTDFLATGGVKQIARRRSRFSKPEDGV